MGQRLTWNGIVSFGWSWSPSTANWEWGWIDTGIGDAPPAQENNQPPPNLCTELAARALEHNCNSLPNFGELADVGQNHLLLSNGFVYRGSRRIYNQNTETIRIAVNRGRSIMESGALAVGTVGQTCYEFGYTMEQECQSVLLQSSAECFQEALTANNLCFAAFEVGLDLFNADLSANWHAASGPRFCRENETKQEELGCAL